MAPVSTFAVAFRYQMYLEVNYVNPWARDGRSSEEQRAYYYSNFVDLFTASLFHDLMELDPLGLRRAWQPDWTIEELELEEIECAVLEADDTCSCGKPAPSRVYAPPAGVEQGFDGAVTRSRTAGWTKACQQQVERTRLRELNERIM